MRLYVASSWKNQRFDSVVERLRLAGFDCYDFKRPNGTDSGFHWSEISVSSAGDTAENYLRGLRHPRAAEGFDADFDAMRWADGCVLVLPCGRSAHLELGWFVGQGRPTAILLDEDPITPELMYKLVGKVTPALDEIVEWLAVPA